MSLGCNLAVLRVCEVLYFTAVAAWLVVWSSHLLTLDTSPAAGMSHGLAAWSQNFCDKSWYRPHIIVCGLCVLNRPVVMQLT